VVSSKTAQGHRGRRVTCPWRKTQAEANTIDTNHISHASIFLGPDKIWKQNQAKSAYDCLPDTNSQRLGIETSIPNQKNCGEARTSFNFLAVENLLCIQGIK
jgi:hypothetical protein